MVTDVGNAMMGGPGTAVARRPGHTQQERPVMLPDPTVGPRAPFVKLHGRTPHSWMTDRPELLDEANRAVSSFAPHCRLEISGRSRLFLVSPHGRVGVVTRADGSSPRFSYAV